MLNKLKQCWNVFFPKPEIVIQKKENTLNVFSTDLPIGRSRTEILQEAYNKVFQRYPAEFTKTKILHGMDSAIPSSKIGLNSFQTTIMSTALVSWYGSQSFIGYQLCAILSQHWLINKCCLMPAEDAIRNGYKITVNSGIEVEPEVLDEIKIKDVEFNLNKHLEEFVNMGRTFGIRIAMFLIDGIDYEKPFNIDGVKPGSYRGISQIDPYWISPELDGEASSDPSSEYFYEPTWWRINGNRVHRTHLIIFRTGSLPDILKPTYMYGAVSIPQKIYERVYAAERTANEAPQLAMTKRTTVFTCDLSQVLANQGAVEQRMAVMSELWNNYGIKLMDREDTALQFDTSLNDLDAVIMTQYQIVAAAANVPATKLLGTTPKGFNASGDYEQDSYHEELKTIQNGDLTPFVTRHHSLLIKSYIAPKFNIETFDTTPVWNPLNEMTSEEQSLVNKTKADTGVQLIASGAINPQDERNRIINDPDSGYSGLEEESIEEPDISEETDND